MTFVFNLCHLRKTVEKINIRWGLKTVAKTVFIGILSEKNSVNSTLFFNFSGLEKVRRLIISLKGDKKGNFPLSLSVKTPDRPTERVCKTLFSVCGICKASKAIVR